MALEIVGSRILAPYFGSSVYVWGSLISIFLAALSAGYYFGGVAADRWPRAGALGLALAAAGGLILGLPPVSRSLLGTFSAWDLWPAASPPLPSGALFCVPRLRLGLSVP